MGPTITGEFSDTKIFGLFETSAKESHQFGNLSACFVESMAGVVVESRVDSESEEAIGACSLCFHREAANLDFGTMSARPLFTW